MGYYQKKRRRKEKEKRKKKKRRRKEGPGTALLESSLQNVKAPLAGLCPLLQGAKSEETTLHAEKGWNGKMFAMGFLTLENESTVTSGRGRVRKGP